jgi:hypothetical protein
MTTRNTPPEHAAGSQFVKKKKKQNREEEKWLKNLFDHITLRKKTHSFRSLLTPHLPGAESSKAFSRTHLLWQTIRKTCSRMLRQTRRKTITVEAARTFPEQNLPSSRSRLLRQTTRTRTGVFSELLLLWLRESFWIGLTNCFMKKGQWLKKLCQN